jgi:geranyl-CoA carboxylase beta subunit
MLHCNLTHCPQASILIEPHSIISPITPPAAPSAQERPAAPGRDGQIARQTPRPNLPETTVPAIESRIDTSSERYARQRAGMLELVHQLRTIEQRAVGASARAKPLFDRRGQLLPRERLARLLDPGSPWIELSTLAGWLVDNPDPEKSVPGSGMICGIGWIAGTRCMIVASDSGIDAGAIQEMGREKMLRGQQIAMENKLPYVQLIESAGANLLKYKVEGFIEGGRIFYNLARLSAAGIPTVGVVHGSSTAGGAYMPGLSDYVIMVRGRAKAFLAGPPLLKAATGEIATDEELGGAEMHTSISGLGEYLAENDADGLRLCRELMQRLQWEASGPPSTMTADPALAPLYDPDELAGVVPLDFREPTDMREIIARIVDRSDFFEFGADYGPQTLCGHARLYGQPVGIITNNGPLDPNGATKATHFIQSCCQSGIPLLYLQNTTGYIVGKASEQAGMIKHGSKMIQAVANASVPSITVHCGASFGAGNYGMCGRSYGPRFVFSWPQAKTAVMGGEQAALTMRIVAEAGAKRKGEPVDEAQLGALEKRIVDNFDRQAGAFYTSARMLDDGVIDPRDTRRVLGTVFDLCLRADRRTVNPMQFGVARP